MPFILGATVLSEVLLTTMRQGEGLKVGGMNHIDLLLTGGSAPVKKKNLLISFAILWHFPVCYEWEQPYCTFPIIHKFI